MANQEHLNRLGQGVEAWNQWRKENPNVRIVLTDANLTGTSLRYATVLIAPHSTFASITSSKLQFGSSSKPAR